VCLRCGAAGLARQINYLITFRFRASLTPPAEISLSGSAILAQGTLNMSCRKPNK
jgi:hypothetical protein